MTIRVRLNGKVWVYRGRSRHRKPEARKGKVIDFQEYMRRRRLQAVMGPQGAA